MEVCALNCCIMSQDSPAVDFSGTIVRFEPDGFGLVQFDEPIGPKANTYGVISSSSNSATVTGPFIRFQLKPGMRVIGTCSPDERDFARVKTVKVIRY